MLRLAMLVLICPLLTAQQPTRQAVAGRVVDVGGTPVQDAEVVLLHRPIPASLEVGPEDRVRTTTNDKGMFRVELLPATTYSSWARWPGGAAGFAEGVTAGEFLRLEQNPWAASRRVRIEGAKPWVDRGPLSYRVLVGSEHIDFLPVAETGGVLAIPALPAMEYRAIEVFDRNGILLWAGGVPQTDATAFVIPEPTTARLLVLDPDTGAPVAGAAIRSHIRNYWYTCSPAVHFGDRFRCLWPVVATTDAEGRAEVQIAAESGHMAGQLPDLYFLAQKAGYRATFSGRSQGQPFRDGKIVTEAADEILLQMKAGKPEPGQVRLSDGPIAKGYLVPTWRVYIQDAGGGGSLGLPFVPPPLAIRDGKLAAPAPPPGSELEHAWTVLPDKARARLRDRFRCTFAAGYVAPWPESLLKKDGSLQLDPDMLRAIEVVSPHGQPAARAVVLVSPFSGGRPHAQRGFLQRTDRHGRALLHLQRETQHLVVLSETGWGTAEWSSEDDEDVAKIALRPLRYADGVIVDDTGEPVPHALVQSSISAVGDEQPVSLEEATYLSALTGPVRADAQGRFRLPYLPLSLDYSLQAQAADRSYTGESEVQFFARDEQGPGPLQLVLERKE